MPLEEQNAPGFYYNVTWRRHDVVPSKSSNEQMVEATSNSLVIDDQPIYKPYEITVKAINEIGPAASQALEFIGYSSEDGKFNVEIVCQNIRT
jgi:hypothetical protein